MSAPNLDGIVLDALGVVVRTLVEYEAGEVPD
jgi:hypothetical protein